MKGLATVAILVMSAASSFGQTALATVTGTISDATGAVLANAPVTLRNLENGQLYAAASSETGNYSVPQLPIGDYDLTVAVAGFKTYTHTKFHLAAGQTMREDITMEVGQTTEAVTVTAESSLLRTETTEVAQNITLAQLNNLPILAVGATNSGFRDPFSATRLVPGIRYAGGSNIGAGNPAAVTTLVVNGTPANSFQARLDGMTATPTGPRLVGAQMQTQPSVDAIEEVAIETSNFAAEFGTTGGAMINMVTKSGTNQYHGSAYDYATNEALNAHQPYTGVRNVVKQHNWGYTVGGPVWIPKIYNGRNKTFFFWSYEQYRNKNINVSNNTTVPLPAYRTGDFSNLLLQESRLITRAGTGAQAGQNIPVTDALGRQIQSGTIFDPLTQATANNVAYRNPFPGNLIPVARFDPITAKILPLIPDPLGGNAARGQASNNYQGTFDSSRTSAIPSIKFDQNLGSKGRFSIYYQDTHTLVPRTPTGADAFADNITGSVASASSGQTIRANYDYTVTPRLLLHLGAGWNDSDFALRAVQNNYDATKELGLVGQTQARYFPRIVLGVNQNTAIGGSSNFGQSTFPTRSMERRPSGTASATYVTGGHTIKLGADWRLEKFPNIIDANVNGTWTFGTNMTEQPSLQGITTNQGFDGFEFASFLLGGMSSNSLNAPIHLSNNKSQSALFIQDNWKVTRKLTLDYGLRWDYGTYAAEQFGRNGSIGLAIPNPSASQRLGATQFEATCKCNFANNYPYAIGPRLGAAYQINTRTVLRVGIGVVYNATSTSSGSSTASAASTTFPGNSGQITGLFQNGMPTNIRPAWPSFDPGVGQTVGGVIGMPQLLDPNAGRPARLLQWNIGLQREVGRNLVVEASYVANRGVWWTASGLAPLNALSEQTLRAYGFNDFTNQTDADDLNALVSSLATNTARRNRLAARGITGLPYANFPSSQTVRQSLRDYPQYTNSGLAGSPLGKTWFDSFQLNVTQRFSHGLAFNLNYNFSKSLDLMSSPDVFNRNWGKDLGGFDLPHQLRLTAQYQVPQLSSSGSGFLSNKFVSAILSDWGVGAFLNYQSAAIIGRPTSNLNPNLNNFLGRGPGSAQLKRDADGNYMNPWSVNWVDNDGKQRTDPLDINCHCFDPTKTQVLNPLAWENIPAGQWGVDQSSLRFYRGARLPTENANFSRNFRIKEGINLNVRIEFNNIFNRLQLPTPRVVAAPGQAPINFATPPTTFNSGANAGLYSGGFGTMNVLSGTSGMRTGTLVGRLTF